MAAASLCRSPQGRLQVTVSKAPSLRRVATRIVQRSDGSRVLDVRILLQTDDGQKIYMSWRGIAYALPGGALFARTPASVSRPPRQNTRGGTM